MIRFIVSWRIPQAKPEIQLTCLAYPLGSGNYESSPAAWLNGKVESREPSDLCNRPAISVRAVMQEPKESRVLVSFAGFC
jgi:hypothetical protein